MIRPDDAAALAKGVREMFADAEVQLLSKVAEALAKGLDAPDWAEQKLLNTQAVLRQLDGILQGLADGVPGAVEQALALAYNRGVAAAGGDLSRTVLGEAAFADLQPTGAVAALAASTLPDAPELAFRVRRAAADLYQQAVTRSTSLVATGALTRREASAKAVGQLARMGLRAFTDVAGRRWEMGSYAEMAVRTSAAQSMLQGAHDRITGLGHDLVIVSDAPEECRVCRPFEGRVLSLTGATTGRLSDGRTVAGTLARARAQGLFHPNCRHSYSVYLPGITKRDRPIPDPAGEKLRNQQRAYERRVRELKREAAATKPFGGAEAAAAKAKLAAKQAEFKDWREANDRKNLTYRTNTTSR